MNSTVHVGNVFDILPTLDAESVNCCVTSPPYWGLRDYGTDGQLGLEPTPDAYVANLVAVFREVRRVLRGDGTLWLNLGDSYAGSGRGAWDVPDEVKTAAGIKETYRPNFRPGAGRADGIVDETGQRNRNGVTCPPGLKPKDLCGIPWRVAFALQADGWWLRSDIIWAKPNPMPESVTDRPTKAHEYVFLLSKRERYYFDSDAVRVAHAPVSLQRIEYGLKHRHPDGIGVGIPPVDTDRMGERFCHAGGRNVRTVWHIATQPYAEAHFATFPEKLVEPCVLAGCPCGGTVLDPFTGSGTTGAVACRLGRNFVGVELNPEYAEMAERRIAPWRDQLALGVFS